MRTVRLRHVTQINPPCPAFDRLSSEDRLTFLPMESVWPGDRLDLSETRLKSEVATGYTRFQDGDVLVPKITPTFEASRSVLVSNLLNRAGAGTTELHVLRAGPDIDSRYLLYNMHSHAFLKLGEAEMYGVAGQKRVPDDFLRNLSVALPTLDEQRRIADFLDAETARIDRMASFYRKTISLTEERKQAVRAHLLDLLADEHGEIPLRRFITKIEQGESPQCENTPANGDAWGVLKLSSIKDGQFFPDENKLIQTTEGSVSQFEVRHRDLLVTRANTPELVGDVAVATRGYERRLLPDLIYRVGLTSAFLPEFAVIALRGPRVRGLIQAVARGSSQSMVKLRGEDIRAWPVPKAPLSTQKEAIATLEERFGKISTLRSKLNNQLSLLAERRQSLITAAVTGQLDVTTAGRAAVG